jgi:hypothetical protein
MEKSLRDSPGLSERPRPDTKPQSSTRRGFTCQSGSHYAAIVREMQKKNSGWRGQQQAKKEPAFEEAGYMIPILGSNSRKFSRQESKPFPERGD